MSKRVLGGIRESREREESTSPKIQRKKINGWTDLHDGELVHIAVDRDVSGKTVSPWDRPDLGQWLAHPERFDVLVVSRLDRVCRNAEDFFQLIRWSEANGVDLVFIDEGFDLTTPAGKVAAKILAVIAEWEWELTRSKTLDGQRTAIQQGHWRGGIAPYGYRPVKETRNGIAGTYLEIDPETSEIVHEICKRIHKESVTAICEDLNSRGVPTSSDAQRIRNKKESKGAQWHPANMIQMLRSRALLGEYRTKDNSTLRDEETGLPISKADPILTREEFAQLQDRLDRVSRKKLQNREGVSTLHDVAYCLVCALKMHHFQSGPRAYYRCSSYNKPGGRCENRMVRAQVLEEQVASSLITVFGDEPMMKREVVPGVNHSEELAVINEQIENLAGNLALVKPGSRAAEITLAQLTDRETRREELMALPSTEDTVLYIPTEETIGQAWLRQEDEEKGQFLRDHDVTVGFAHPHGVDDNDVTILVSWGKFEEMKAALATFGSDG